MLAEVEIKRHSFIPSLLGRGDAWVRMSSMLTVPYVELASGDGGGIVSTSMYVTV
jgi:hypothetical protein